MHFRDHPHTLFSFDGLGATLSCQGSPRFSMIASMSWLLLSLNRGIDTKPDWNLVTSSLFMMALKTVGLRAFSTSLRLCFMFWGIRITILRLLESCSCPTWWKKDASNQSSYPLVQRLILGLLLWSAPLQQAAARFRLPGCAMKWGCHLGEQSWWDAEEWAQVPDHTGQGWHSDSTTGELCNTGKSFDLPEPCSLPLKCAVHEACNVHEVPPELGGQSF